MKKNVMLIVIDSFYYKYINEINAPTLSKLIKENFSCTKMYSQAAFTEAAIMPLITGKSAFSNGGYINKFEVRDTDIFKIFKQNDFDTYYTMTPEYFDIGKLIIKYHLEDAVIFLGNLNEQQMCERYLLSNIFVFDSSIENSPNSVGEAMFLGVKNMLTHGKEGFIYLFNEFYTLAYYICKVFSEAAFAMRFSENSKNHAKITHSREINLKTMLNIYEEVYIK